MTTQEKAGVSPVYAPRFISRHQGMDLIACRAAESIELESRKGLARRTKGLPGVATRVLTFLRGAAARRSFYHSRHSIARRSGIPLSSVRGGVRALIEAGWMVELPAGQGMGNPYGGELRLRLVLHASPAALGSKPKQVANPKEKGGGEVRPQETPTGRETKSLHPREREVPAPKATEGLLTQVVQSLESLGAVDAGPLRAALRKSPFKGEEILRVLRSAVAVVNYRRGQTWAKPIQDPVAWVVGALGSVERGRDAIRDAKRYKSRAKGQGGPTRDRVSVSAADAWRELATNRPPEDHPGYLDHCDAELKALGRLVGELEPRLSNPDELREGLRNRLQSAGLEPGTPLWGRAWDHQWSVLVLKSLGLSS